MWQLVLEADASGLWVVAFSPFEEHALIFERVPFDETESSPLQAIEDAVYDNPMLLLDFSKVTVLFDTRRFMALPMMPQEACETMLRASLPADATVAAEVLVSPLPAMGSCVSFEVPADILGFLRRTFHNASILHPLAPAAAYFQARHPRHPSGKTLVNITGNRLDVVTLGDKAPQVLNSFRFETPMDALYYILATRGSADVADTDEIMVAGDLKARAALTPLLRKYVRYVMPAIFPSVMFRAGKASLSAPFEMIVAPLTAASSSGQLG